MAYYLNKTPALDSILLTSCQSMKPGAVNVETNQFFVNEQSDYWNIDDILAEEELVPCTFKEDGKNLGYLDAMD